MFDGNESEKLQLLLKLCRSRVAELETPSVATIEDIAIISTTIGSARQIFEDSGAPENALQFVDNCLAFAASSREANEMFDWWCKALEIMEKSPNA